MAATADIVIIGGGATGASIAYHLARRGLTAAVVVEKNLLASGPTGRSSACVRQHYSTPETCRMVLKALRFFERFEELTGGRTAGFVRTGYLLAVDDRLRTTNPRIYAAGDVCSHYKFTHAADAMARVVIQNALFLGRAKASFASSKSTTTICPRAAARTSSRPGRSALSPSRASNASKVDCEWNSSAAGGRSLDSTV